MGMHIYFLVRKVLQSTIYSAEFMGIPSNKKFETLVKYIHDNKSRERCYVLIIIIFPCLRVLCLEDSNHAGIDKVYYY